MTLPEKGWKGYGAPGWHLPGLSARIIHPQIAFPNREGVAIHEIHAGIAECRLDREGIKPELLAYLAGIGAKP